MVEFWWFWARQQPDRAARHPDGGPRRL